jgi:predicted NUDIX family NTP pyrophosphohydrolase
MKQSAGVLLYRNKSDLEVLLVHPGGPFWTRKDLSAWSVPKGEYEEGEDPKSAAVRELKEETGIEVQTLELRDLGEIKQKSGKTVKAWTAESDFDPKELKSNTFELEWPPRSGQKQEFPEVDRVEWFDIETAKAKILPAQIPFLERLGQ